MILEERHAGQKIHDIDTDLAKFINQFTSKQDKIDMTDELKRVSFSTVKDVLSGRNNLSERNITGVNWLHQRALENCMATRRKCDRYLNKYLTEQET